MTAKQLYVERTSGGNYRAVTDDSEYFASNLYINGEPFKLEVRQTKCTVPYDRVETVDDTIHVTIHD